MLAGALTFGELAARRPESGGLYVYLREAWGERAAFLYGWQCLLVLDPGVTAGLATGLARYVVAALPGTSGHERAIALAAVWVLAAAPMAGLKPSVRLLSVLTTGKVLALLAVPAVAFAAGHGSLAHFEPFFARHAGAPPIGGALAAGLVGVFFSFGGFWEASRLAGEIRLGGRALPRALAVGTAAVTLIYVLTTAAFLYLVPAESTRDGATFARRAGEALFGHPGPALLAGIVVLCAAASALALLLMAPRVYVAMSRDGLFSSALAASSAATGSPTRATALLATISSIYVLSGTFEQILPLFLCPALVFVALAAAGLFRVRRSGREAAPGFRCPGYPATPIFFIAFLVAVAVIVAIGHPLPVLVGLAIVALGIPAYRLFSARPNPRRHAS